MKIKRLTLSIVLILLLVLPMVFAIAPFVIFSADRTQTTTEVELSVTAMDLTHNVDWIKIYENDNEIKHIPCAGPVCRPPTIVIEKQIPVGTSETFDYQAKARNLDGEIRESSIIPVTFYGEDTQSPVYSNINPASPYTITYDAQPVTLNVDWTDDTAIAAVVIQGDLVGGTTQSGNTYTYTVNNQNVGTYNWYMRAVDIEGNQEITPTQTLIITKINPDIHLYLNGAENSISVLRGSTVDIQGTTIAPGDLIIKEDGLTIGTGPSPLDILGRLYNVKDVFNIELIYSGSTNYNSDTVSYQITVTDQPPVVTLQLPIDGEKITDINGDVTFTYTATDDISLVSCELIIDGTSMLTDITAPFDTFTLPGLALGPHTWTITCTDDYSQITTPSPFSFTLQNGYPIISNTQPVTPYNILTGSLVNFQIDVTDPEGNPLDVEWFVGPTSEQIDAGVSSGSPVTFSYTFTLEQPYTVRVEVVDAISQMSSYEWTINSINSVDSDGDGYYADAGYWGSADCNDGEPTIYPGAPELCDNLDNQCPGDAGFGLIDENLILSCYTGPFGTQGVGICHSGTQTCSAGSWGTCNNEQTPEVELCDSLDNDCDGSIDEDFYPDFQYTIYIPGTISLDKDEGVKLIFPDSTIYYATLQAFSPDYIILIMQQSINQNPFSVVIYLQDLEIIDLNNQDLAVTYNGMENNKASITFDVARAYESSGSDHDGRSRTYSGPTSSVIDFVKEEIQELPGRVKRISEKITSSRNQETEAMLAATVLIFLLMLGVIAHFTKRHWDKWI